MSTTSTLVSNSYVSSNPDIKVRADENASQERIQVVRVDVGSGSSELPLTAPFPVTGNNNEGTAFTKPLTVAFKDVFTNTTTVPHTITYAGANYLLALSPDLELHFIDYSLLGETYSLTHSTDGTKTGATYARLGPSKEQYTTEYPLASSTVSNVSASTSSVTISASDSTRRKCCVSNDSAAECYLKLGSSASSTSFTIKLQKNDYYETPDGYTGIITAAWSSATGSARVTDLRI